MLKQQNIAFGIVGLIAGIIMGIAFGVLIMGLPPAHSLEINGSGGSMVDNYIALVKPQICKTLNNESMTSACI